MRIKRLEGYQPYDQFVERRLGGEFDFIDRLGRRYERAKNDISMLDQNYLSIETEQVAIDTKQVAIDTAKLQAETCDVDRGIHAIQEWGEFALLGALVPYYMIQLLEHTHVVHGEYLPIMTIEVWAALAAFACFRKFKKQIDSLKSIYYALVLSCLVLFPISLFVILWWPDSVHSRIFRLPETPSEQPTVQTELRNMQEKLGKMQNKQLNLRDELAEIQREQIKVQKEVLDAQNAEREKEKAAPPRLPPKHQQHSVQ